MDLELLMAELNEIKLPPMPESADPEELRAQSKEYSKNIYRDYKLLRAILCRHQQTIGKRWHKKSKQNKLNVILTAWRDDMPKGHRPDFEALRREGPQLRTGSTKFRSWYLWPHFNQEDLCRPSILPQMLYARASRPPTDFAAMDMETSHIGRVSIAIVPAFLNEYVTLLHGQDEGSYGTLLHWDEHEDAFEWMTTRKQYLPGEALLVLECQERIMQFLVDCVKQILHDVEEQDLTTSDQGAVLIPPPSSGPSTFSTLRNMAQEAPYRIPAKIDFSRMTSLIAASHEASKDHLWLLCDDPDYFSHFMGDVFEHRQEHIKSDDGQVHVMFRTGHSEILWARVLCDGISSALGFVDIWAELHAQIKNIDELHIKHLPQVGEDLHPELLYAILKFRHSLSQAAKVSCNLLKTAVPGSPSWRACFVRSREASATDTRISIRTRDNVNLRKNETYLLWLFDILCQQDRQLWILRLHNIMDEVQRILDTNQEEKSLVSSYVSSIFSDLAVFGECQRQLEIFQPWAREFEHHLVELRDRIEQEYYTWTVTLTTILSALKLVEGPMTKYGNPNGGRFNYPTQRSRTRENVQARQKAEENLDEFWTAVRQGLNSCSKSLSQSAAWRVMESPREILRTRPWTEHEDQPPAARKNLPPTSDPPGGLHSSAESSAMTGRSVQLETARRRKIKTKGPSFDANDDVLNVANGATAMQDEQIFVVDARAFKTFSMLFHSPNAVNLPGELPWAELLHAMAAVGARAEKLYGSAWRFEIDSSGATCSIQIHEPHPGGKMSFTTARRHGRRLFRAFGWSIENFLLQQAR